jgi:hypothetical protein
VPNHWRYVMRQPRCEPIDGLGLSE